MGSEAGVGRKWLWLLAPALLVIAVALGSWAFGPLALPNGRILDLPLMPVIRPWHDMVLFSDFPGGGDTISVRPLPSGSIEATAVGNTRGSFLEGDTLYFISPTSPSRIGAKPLVLRGRQTLWTRLQLDGRNVSLAEFYTAIWGGPDPEAPQKLPRILLTIDTTGVVAVANAVTSP